MPVARTVRVAEDFENGKRPAQQRIGTARGLDHHELTGQRERGDLGRGEGDDAVIIRQSRVGDHRGVDVDGHRRSIHLRHALPADADELGARRRPRRRVSHRARAAAESADPDPVVEHLALVPDARHFVRRPPRRDLLRGDGGARVLRSRRVLARVGERADAGLDGRRRRCGRGDAHVAQRSRLQRGADGGCRLADDGGSRRDDRVGRSCSSPLRSRITRSGGAAGGSAHRCS